MRATLGEVLTDQAFEHMIGLATRFTDGVQEVHRPRGVPWSVVQLGARAEYRFTSPAPATAASRPPPATTSSTTTCTCTCTTGTSC